VRIGALWQAKPAATYRLIEPLRAMERRGHEIVWPDARGICDVRLLSTCDVVHVYRLFDGNAYTVLGRLARSGTPLVWDNDDDFAALPKESANYRHAGGVTAHHAFTLQIKVASMARVVTTPSEGLAERFRGAGVRRVQVVPNALPHHAVRPTIEHEGIVIGWIAATEHRAEVPRVPFVDALSRLLEARLDVRVECIGVDLGLRSERYRYDKAWPFDELPVRIGGFDIGIAPLADIAFNRSRSDIKVKEYAASGVPWLASAVGPYVGLGESEGGRLVPDDGWFEALDRLVTRSRERRKLGKKGAKWAKGQRIDAFADRWEAVFLEAAGMR
jgi:glycosyltransferase involved in cell wall biosynthesis